jgi:hypothetical protein
MPRKAIPVRTRAALQQEIRSTCPFCDNADVEHFEVHHIDEDHGNNEKTNLVMLCPLCHSKITKGDISMDQVKNRKKEISEIVLTPRRESNVIQFTGKVGSAIVGDNNIIRIQNVAKKIKQKYPEGCIGFDNLRANYLGYLIAQYNEYKEWELGKEGMNYAVLPSLLKRQLKLGPTRTIYNAPIEQFEKLVQDIQNRIDGTKLAKIKKSKGQFKNYRSLAEYQHSQIVSSNT